MLRRGICNLRERMVLGPFRSLLDADEPIQAWTHVVGDGDRSGLLFVTERRCLLHIGSIEHPPVLVSWAELTGWDLTTPASGSADVTLGSVDERLDLRLPLTTAGQTRKANEVMECLHRSSVVATSSEATDKDTTGPIPLPPVQRDLRGHLRRVIVTVVGVLVILISAVFASPFFPGPGALTFLAGLALLAREYDWARDVHTWVRRKFEQMWAWWKRRREQRRLRRSQRTALRLQVEQQRRLEYKQEVQPPG